MRATILLTLAMVALLVPRVQAQSKQLEEKQKAIASFDIRFEKVRDSDLAETLGLKELVKRFSSPRQTAGPGDITRITGAISAPDSMEDFKGFNGRKDLPIEMSLRLELVDSEVADKVMAGVKKSGEPIEINGKTFFRATDGSAPSNLLAHRIGDTTVEMATEAYLMQSGREFFTEGLNALLDKTPDEAVRIAVDFSKAESFVKELQDLIDENGPPNFSAYYELIGGISGLRLTADVEGANLLTLGLTGKSDDQTEELEGGLKSLVGIGQMMSMGAVGQIKQQSPKLGAAVETIVNELKVDRAEGSNDIEVKIVHPDGFAEAVKTMIGN